MQIDLSRFLETFFEEAAEHVATLEEGLLRLETAPDDVELLNEVFRRAHSIKGGAGTFGLKEVARLTHALEDLLGHMRDGRAAVSAGGVDVLLRATDSVRALLAAARSGTQAPAAIDQTIAALEACARQRTPRPQIAPRPEVPEAGEAGSAEYLVEFAPGPDLFRQGIDPFLLLRDLARLGRVVEVSLDATRVPPFAELDPEQCYLGWSMRLATSRPLAEIREVFLFVEDTARVSVEPARLRADREATPARASESVSAAPPEGPRMSSAARPAVASADRDRPSGVDRRTGAALDAGSIRVATEKVDKLVDLVGELVIAQSMVTQVLNHFSSDKLPALAAAVGDVERNVRELQERVMAVRMVPLGSLFNRFPRLVRDLSAGFGKQVAVEMSGGETELDKGMVEHLGDPLTHLIRNAVDHGIETPEERVRAGKPEQGVVRLHAFHEGGSVIVEVSDDGRGLDTQRIREKAASLGLIDASDVMPDEAVHALIFHPGFSTAAVVSDVSGRGVGMDVVKRNVEALNGSVAIDTRSGAGTRFRIKLPLTLAILDGLLVSAGRETYVLPLASVVESFRPAASEIRTVLGRGEVVTVRGQAVPLVRLGRLLGSSQDGEGALVVLVEHEGLRHGLLLNEVLGQTQVVIKSLEANYRKVDGVMGATVLGDGCVALILDVPGLLRVARDRRGAMHLAEVA